jgi:CheY-like chemotaxis protein
MNNGTTCFLIDDDADELEIFEIALKDVNPSIAFMAATDSEKAVQKLVNEEAFNPDYIFLDLNMPRMDGKTCLREIRKIERLTATPVIIYSTSANLRDIQETKALGANDYLEKQASIAVLKSKLANILNS